MKWPSRQKISSLHKQCLPDGRHWSSLLGRPVLLEFIQKLDQHQLLRGCQDLQDSLHDFAPLLQETFDGLLPLLRRCHPEAPAIFWIEHPLDITLLLQPIQDASERRKAHAVEFVSNFFDHQGTTRLHPQEKHTHVLWVEPLHLLLKVPLFFVDQTTQKEDKSEQGRCHLLMIRKR